MSVPVSVLWHGHRAKILFEGKKFITVAKFKEDLNWKKEAWSIILEFDVTPKDQGNPSKGRASFLFDTAPLNRLKQGCEFELYEGESLSAKVIVE